MIEKEVLLNKDILLYEVENIANKISRSRLREDNLVQCIEMQADEAEQDRAVTTRSIDNAVSSVISRMSVYVKDFTGERIDLQFPDGWRESVFPELVGSIKDYVINMGVFEWLRITLPQEAQGFRELADESYGKVKSCISARKAGSVYRPLQPF